MPNSPIVGQVLNLRFCTVDKKERELHDWSCGVSVEVGCWRTAAGPLPLLSLGRLELLRLPDPRERSAGMVPSELANRC